MTGFSKTVKIAMLQAVLTRMQASSSMIVMLGNELLVSESPDSPYWTSFDGSRGSDVLPLTMALDTSGDIPYLYNTTELTFTQDSSSNDMYFMAIFDDITQDFILIHPLAGYYEWQGYPFVLEAGDFRVYI